MAALRHQAIALGGVVERNAYLVKRYGWWELAFFVWTVANTLTIVFIAEGVEAAGGRLDVGQGLLGLGRAGVAGGVGELADPVTQGLAGLLDVGVVDLAEALVQLLGGLLGLGRGLLHVVPVDPGQLADQGGAVGRLVDPLADVLGLLGGLAAGEDGYGQDQGHGSDAPPAASPGHQPLAFHASS